MQNRERAVVNDRNSCNSDKVFLMNVAEESDDSAQSVDTWADEQWSEGKDKGRKLKSETAVYIKLVSCILSRIVFRLVMSGLNKIRLSNRPPGTNKQHNRVKKRKDVAETSIFFHSSKQSLPQTKQ